MREGEYIQVIDVQGRQCSDFLAFHRGKLERGLERGLDGVTTRTLMGNAYPSPGLQGKFYDADMDPLVEVVRDTVGRHDTFALACTPKYYEDMGYPGHVNCTENFNGAGHALRDRRAQGLGGAQLLLQHRLRREQHPARFDEPWSRPGDYVLLRAMTDLVCASSACPDDIDPANGWEITDVHVRVYSPENRFSMAIAHRVTPEAEPVLTKETAFHPRTCALTESFVEYRGYWLPHCYNNEGAIAEYWACREKAVVMDLSPLRKWEVLGPDAESADPARDHPRRPPAGRRPGRLHRGLQRDRRHDRRRHRLPARRRQLPLRRRRRLRRRLAQGPRRAPRPEGVRQALDRPAAQPRRAGAASREIMQQLVWTPPTQPGFEELKWFRFLVGRFGDYDGIPVVVSRTGYTGELGYEVFCHPDDGPAVWDAIWEAGQPHGLKPLGLEALDMMRIEAGLIFAGYEFDDQVDPFEAGIGFAVKLDSDEDFVGKEALEERHAHPQRRLVGLELEGNETAGHGDEVYIGRRRVGVVTSGTRSPTLRKNVALCRMAVQYAELGTEVEVGKLDGLQKRIAAKVVRFPFYDPDKTRPRS